MLYKVVVRLESCGAVYYAVQYKVVLTFESVGKIQKCDHSNESY